MKIMENKIKEWWWSLDGKTKLVEHTDGTIVRINPNFVGEKPTKSPDKKAPDQIKMKKLEPCEGCVCTQEDRNRYGLNWDCDHAKADKRQMEAFMRDMRITEWRDIFLPK